jgi:hypothetical protein
VTALGPQASLRHGDSLGPTHEDGEGMRELAAGGAGKGRGVHDDNGLPVLKARTTGADKLSEAFLM